MLNVASSGTAPASSLCHRGGCSALRCATAREGPRNRTAHARGEDALRFALFRPASAAGVAGALRRRAQCNPDVRLDATRSPGAPAGGTSFTARRPGSSPTGVCGARAPAARVTRAQRNAEWPSRAQRKRRRNARRGVDAALGCPAAPLPRRWDGAAAVCVTSEAVDRRRRMAGGPHLFQSGVPFRNFGKLSETFGNFQSFKTSETETLQR